MKSTTRYFDRHFISRATAGKVTGAKEPIIHRHAQQRSFSQRLACHTAEHCDRPPCHRRYRLFYFRRMRDDTCRRPITRRCRHSSGHIAAPVRERRKRMISRRWAAEAHHLKHISFRPIFNGHDYRNLSADMTSRARLYRYDDESPPLLVDDMGLRSISLTRLIVTGHRGAA